MQIDGNFVCIFKITIAAPWYVYSAKVSSIKTKWQLLWNVIEMSKEYPEVAKVFLRNAVFSSMLWYQGI